MPVPVRPSLEIGDIVSKITPGTEVTGRIVSIYEIDPGDWRMDVRSIVPGARRLVLVHRPEHFRTASPSTVEKLKRMDAIWDA